MLSKEHIQILAAKSASDNCKNALETGFINGFNSAFNSIATNAIQFAEWINEEGYREYDGYDRWIAPHNSNDVYETKQLYEMFLKEKQ